MSLFLDSAWLEDARQAAALGFVHGATTNPTLMAQSGRASDKVIAQLCDLLPGLVFYQLTADGVAEREDEARRMAALRPERVGLKIPCTLENLALCARLAAESYVCGMTAIFSPAQVYLAIQAGARYVLPYVNRSTRLLGDGLALVRAMRQVIDAEGAPTEIIAASLKSPAEAIDALLAGAHHLTLPLDVIQQMGQHPLSDAAIADFRQAGR